MKKQSRIIALTLVGVLGLIPFYSLDAIKFSEKEGYVYVDTPQVRYTDVGGYVKIPETEVKFGEVGATVIAVTVGAIVGILIGKAINKVTFTKIVNSLREQFPNYPTYALELAATARFCEQNFI